MLNNLEHVLNVEAFSFSSAWRNEKKNIGLDIELFKASMTL